MLLTLALLTCFLLTGLGLTVGLLSLLEALFQRPGAASRRVDSRRKAAEALIVDADTFLAHSEALRNVAQSA
jgi:hypothetical protein